MSILIEYLISIFIAIRCSPTSVMVEFIETGQCWPSFCFSIYFILEWKWRMWGINNVNKVGSFKCANWYIHMYLFLMLPRTFIFIFSNMGCFWTENTCNLQDFSARENIAFLLFFAGVLKFQLKEYKEYINCFILLEFWIFLRWNYLELFHLGNLNSCHHSVF